MSSLINRFATFVEIFHRRWKLVSPQPPDGAVTKDLMVELNTQSRHPCRQTRGNCAGEPRACKHGFAPRGLKIDSLILNPFEPVGL